MAISMKNLTISTAGRGFFSAACHLPVPRDYFAGSTSAPPVLPDHLLMFVRRHSRQLGAVPHAHHRFVLLTALGGAGEVVVDEVAHRLGPDRAVLIFPFQFHHYLFARPTAVAWVFTTFELPSDAPLEPLRGRTLTLTERVLGDLTRACSSLDESRGRKSGTNAIEARLRVSLALTALVGAVSPRPSLPASYAVTTELLERVGRHVFAHLHEPISVGELARGVGLSETHLRHELRTRYGLSPHGYVRQVKMLQAMRLLRATTTSISDIADGLGYSSLFAFSRSFKLETGQSPRAYRRPHRSAGTA